MSIAKTMGLFLRRRRGLITPTVPATVCGRLASFVSPALQPVDITAQLIPAQAGSGDPAPDNDRPITGRAGLLLRRRGKNLARTGSRTSAGDVASDLPTGVPLTASMYVDSATGGDVRIRFSYSLGGSTQFINGNYTGAGSWSTVTGTFPEGATGCRALVSRQSNVTFSVSSIQIEVGTERTTYEPYHAALDIPVIWTDAGMVYAGTLDTSTGELVVTSKSTLINDLSLSYSTTYQHFSSSTVSSTIKRPANNSVPLDGLLCEIYQTGVATSSMAADNSIACSAVGQIFIYTTEYTTQAAIKAAYGTKKIIYPLAEPETYQLTPLQVSAIAGITNIWTGVGDISVNYKKFAWQS